MRLTTCLTVSLTDRTAEHTIGSSLLPGGGAPLQVEHRGAYIGLVLPTYPDSSTVHCQPTTLSSSDELVHRRNGTRYYTHRPTCTWHVEDGMCWFTFNKHARKVCQMYITYIPETFDERTRRLWRPERIPECYS